MICRKKNPIIYTTDMEDSHNKGRQAGPDVEITPEMIEAGIEVFSNYSDRFDSGDELVKNIYRAMARVNLIESHPDRGATP